MKLSLVVPCYNEAENVAAFQEAVIAAFDSCGYDYEIVFVNDGSRDNTWKELKALLAEGDANIKIINFSRNFGKEAAMYAGLKNSKGDYVAIMDADLQDPPALLPEMYDAIVKENKI